MVDNIEEKLKQMQDEMNRFEKEIGLPLSHQGAPERPKVIGANTYHEVQRQLEAQQMGLPCPPPPVPPSLSGLIPPPPTPPSFIPAQIRPGYGPTSLPQQMNEPTIIQPQSTVLSATPMLYVANPQREIAARAPKESHSGHSGISQIEIELLMESDSKKLNMRKHHAKMLAETCMNGRKRDKKNRKLIRTAGGQTWEDPTLAEWEDDDFRLFCGDLGNDVTDEVLTRAFAKYSSFVKAKVVRDKRTNKTKGYGFVSFKDPQDFIRASKEMNGRYVGSRPIKLRKSTWKNRCLDIVRKKDKEKQALINTLIGK